MFYKNWWVHNVIAHPIMQVFNSLGRLFLWLGKSVHNSTLPNEKSGPDE